ncbi:MAG: FliL family protein [Phycisphaerales bacterium]|nr:FliL family protein [Phycisphaerales bacterium]MDB5299866.1 FliL family protein [Phycisphaerales bacterium]MDB5299879.1 FliL family protein [Phycisphaerales bacterium]MDB5305473.1 FliL family protein [Phycisphaerales bacterium]
MSEKAEKKPEASPAGAAGDKKAAKGGGLMTKLPVLLGGVMIIEAVVLFAGFKFLGGGTPHSANGAELASGHEEKGKEGEGAAAAVDKKSQVEVQVVDFRSPNKQSGHTYLYDVSIVAVTKAQFEEQVKKKITDRGALIRDRVRTIIAQSDPEKLGGGSEPGLETLRRQVKYQLDEIVGEGMIDEVLVPKCIPFRTDF